MEVVKELDSLEMSVRLQPHLPVHRLLDDEDHSAKLRLKNIKECYMSKVHCLF